MTAQSQEKKIGFISLGCPKALVDSENILTSLVAKGYHVIDSYEGADLIIINTCSFIESAIEESMAAIDEALKRNGKVIVTGCLGAKEGVVETKYPGVLGVTGPNKTTEVLQLVDKYLPKEHDPFLDLANIKDIKLTPKHYAYLKISEGCNNSCTFCIIPSLRGKLNSYPIASVLSQAKRLVDNGYKELLVISQDTSAYGVDIKYRTEFYNGRPLKTKLLELAQELGKLGAWIRLHYVYPYPHVDEIIPLMRDGLILPYLDIPFQHASPKILKAMKRPANVENILERINLWRSICPDLTIRSTFIVGFPGETEEDFAMLLNFLDKAELDHAGCFKYSQVDGAVSNNLESHVKESTKEERYECFMKHQAKISEQKLRKKHGSTLEVIIDKITSRHLIGRTKYNAPEIDGLFYIKNRQNIPTIQVGDIVKATVTDNDEHDLYGELAIP